MPCFRASRPDDVERLFAIWQAAVAATHSFLTPDDFTAIGRLVRDAYLPAACFTVATDEEDRPLGFIGMTGAHIDALFVDPDRHGQGIGRALIRQAGGDRPGATVDVNEQNAGATGFYERLGFRRFGRSETDDAGRPYPLLHLSLETSIGA